MQTLTHKKALQQACRSSKPAWDISRLKSDNFLYDIGLETSCIHFAWSKNVILQEALATGMDLDNGLKRLALAKSGNRENEKLIGACRAESLSSQQLVKYYKEKKVLFSPNSEQFAAK